MKKLNSLIVTYGLFLSSQVIAGSMGMASLPQSLVFTLSLGPAWEKAGNTQTFYLVPDIKKTYQATPEINTLISGEAFLGLQHTLNERFIGQLGVAVAGTSHAQLNGNIWENADPEFNNFYYSTQLSQIRVSLKGKLLADIRQIILPYISAGIGAGFNHAYDFVITPKIADELPAPAFRSNTTTTLTYTLGTGIQKALNQHWQAGLGYEFADWGQSELSRAPDQTLGHGLQLNHLYTHELQFSLSYIS